MYIDDAARERFSNQVIQRAKKSKLPFMDCVLELAGDMNIEPGAAGKLLTKPLIEKIQIEAQNLHLLKKSKTKSLPIDWDRVY